MSGGFDFVAEGRRCGVGSHRNWVPDVGCEVVNRTSLGALDSVRSELYFS